MKRKAYSSVVVNEVDVASILSGREGAPVDVGLDIGKKQIWVVLRWGAEDFERPWRVGNPSQLMLLRDVLVELSRGRQLRLGVEPSGTYGDPLRQLLADAGLRVERVGSKIAHDYAEVFDSVPSQHDGKDAAVVAELVALRKSREWPFRAGRAWEQELSYWVEQLVVEGRQLQVWIGRLEGLLMRHWPELPRQHRRLTSTVLLQAVVKYGGPARLAADGEAAEQLRRWSHGQWSPAKIDKVVSEARLSTGVRLQRWSRGLLRRYAGRALRAKRRVQQACRELRRVGSGHAVLRSQAQVVGLPTACVLWNYLGDPRGYESAAAYRKAMGLNLKERSSGVYQGKLKISKRGQGVVRRLLYLAALRCCQQEPVRSWYVARKQAGQSTRLVAVAIMRKLSLVLQPLGVHGGTFSLGRLFRKKSAAKAKRSAGTKAAPAKEARRDQCHARG